jgi:hypothetical protein
VLVHRRGKVDSQFVEQVADFPQFSGLKEGDEIELDGSMTNKMRDSGMYVGRKLVELVDAELLRQKPIT